MASTMKTQAETGKQAGGMATAVTTGVVVGVFRTHHEAEAAIKALERSGYDLRSLSIVGKGYETEQQPIGYYNTGDRMKHWGKLGAFWGGIWGLLFGSAFFWIPGVGPLLIGGPLVSALVGALEGAVVVGGLSALGAGLYSIGIPRDSVVEYETAIRANKYLVIAHGPGVDIQRTRETISKHGAERVDVHEGQPTNEPSK